MLPAARLLPFTVIEAAPFTSCAEPSAVLPAEKVTLPVGTAVPVVARTDTVTCVEAEDAMLDGFAATVVVVETAEGAVTVTVAVPLDAAKLPVGV